jgi:tetratricopeptide (TPR) repeat protein
MVESRAHKRARLRTLLFMVSLWLCMSQSAFGSGWVPTTKQYFLLPDYCQAKMSEHMRGPLAGEIGRTSVWRGEAAVMLVPEAQMPRWKNRVGADFLHLHHYCYALALMNDADDPVLRRRGGASPGAIYGQALAQIEATRSKSRPGAPLWEVMTISYARALAGSGDWGESQAVFQELLANNPSNSDIWLEYAKQLKRRGKVNDAITLLEQGLDKANKKGPLLYWLAIYQFDLGDLTRAAETTARAEAAGMKVDSLKRRLGRTAVPAAAD